MLLKFYFAANFSIYSQSLDTLCRIAVKVRWQQLIIN